MVEENKDLYMLVYSSRAVEQADRVKLVDICAAAVKKNKRLGVTGVLLCVGNQFVQVLEGNQAIVKKLYDEIRRDARHTQCRVLYEGAISARAFPDWGMNFIRMDDKYFLQFEEFQELRGYIEKQMEKSGAIPEEILKLVLRIPKILASYKIDIEVVSPLTLDKGGS